MGEKWKISKKETSNSSTSTSKTSLFSRSCSTRGSSSNSPLLLKSLSQKSSSTSNNSSNNLPRSYSQKNPSIGKKCTNIAKEQKARFYIMRKCVSMLVCWHKHGDK
ncbi:small polypeptide DEVIL 13 [Trifolium pratense]|uniref:small polypeptide DEVIL 13 n=1 Tax=Trifolium pratense TaxID=57577 RepID=UPI001E6904EA|nr:small polypeptide DEVIL 13 [Trifolium pratense]